MPLCFLTTHETGISNAAGEYLAELQRFAAVPEGPLRRHALEAHLGRWPLALRALVDAGDAQSDAALQLAKDKVRPCS